MTRHHLLAYGFMALLGCTSVAADQGAEESEADQASAAADASAPRPLVTTEQADQALSQLRPESAVWLELDDGDRTLGLFYAEQKPPAHGALVILADVGDNAASGVAEALGQRLTEKGWSVLALGLPAPAAPLQRLLETRPEPEADAAGEAEAEEESSVMIDVMAAPVEGDPEQRYRSRIRQSLAAAKRALAERGYDQPALVGLGRASNHLVDTENELQGVGALIWIAPEFYARDAGNLAEVLATGGDTTILELYASRGDGRDESQRRWAELRRAGVERVERQPVALNRPVSAQSAGMLAGRIDAWLRER